MDTLVKTTVAEVQAALGRRRYAADPASDGMSVQVTYFPRAEHASQRLREAFEVLDALKAAGLWAADTETYWNADVADLIADGKPVWVGRNA